MKTKTIVIIFFIVLITLSTRFIGLDLVPVHLSNDEISIAYDAYSVSKTLRDEHNHFLPISFQSHGTYKAPLTIYLTIPTTILLGNNEYSTRLPSAILGSLTVLMLGLLIFELTKNSRLALLGSFILAVTPWHIYSSRMALEANIALFFVTTGIYLFFYGLKRQNTLATLGSYIVLATSLYAYHTEWGFTPLLLLLLWVVYRKEVLKKPFSYFGAILFLLILIPLFIDFWHNLGTNARANTEFINNDPYLSKQLHDNSLNILQKIREIFNIILQNYSNYTNHDYAFFNGLNLLPKDDPFQIGLFLSPFIVNFTVGLFNIKKYFLENTKFIYGWLIISPLIPALTIGEVNNVRNLVTITPFAIVIAAGSLVIWDQMKNRLLKISSILLIFIFFIYFLAIYFYHFPYQSGVNFQYGYKQIAEFIKPRYDQFDKIIIDPRFGDHGIYSGVPHLYIPYYTNLPPRKLLERQDTPTVLYFDKYELRPIDWDKEALQPSYLYIVPVSNTPISKDLKKLIEINLPNHQPAFDIYSY